MLNQVVQMFILPAASKLSSAGNFKSLKAVIEKAILFSTITLLPVFVLFLFLPSIWVTILYKGRYMEAIPLLQILSLLSFVIPVTAVGANALLGMGQARLSFILSLQVLVVSMSSYLILIPWLGGFGAAIGFIVISYVTAWLTSIKVNRFVDLSFGGVMRRTEDIKMFLQSKSWRNWR
jgi:O-antigen/teichoic acid export membrane protein